MSSRQNATSTTLGYPAEIIPGKLYFACASVPPGSLPQGLPRGALAYWLDQDLIYEPFCADFGPCNLAHTWRFSQRVNQLLHQAESRKAPLYLLVGPHPHKRANAAALVGIHSVIFLNKRAEEAYAPLRPLEPFVGFRDASCGVPTYTLGVADVIRGMARARDVGFINWHKGEVLDVDEYEHYEQVENGDLNWIVPGKLMAFSGPSATPKHFGGWRTFTPEDYIEYFREKGVTTVVRLNKKMYEASRFTAHGVTHHDMYFPDGTCPSEPILYRFLDIAEREPGALAVHCKAGLGRTGVLISAYMIKHYGFTAEEAMAYIRVCRPGSVIGPQQHYLMQYAPRLLHEGQLLRRLASVEVAKRLSSSNNNSGQNNSPIRPAASAHSTTPTRKVINIVATSRTADILRQQAAPAPAATSPLQQGTRKSPRLSASTGSLPRDAASTTSSPTRSFASTNRLNEPNHIVSVPERHLPPASPTKPANARGAPMHIRVEAEDAKLVPGTATPLRYPTRAAMPSLASSPALTRQSSADTAGAATPVAMKTAPVPPSSTKRVLAPNGQPRKIPLAVDFDAAVDGAALEDRDLVEVVGGRDYAEDSWTVTSQPVHDKNYSSSSRVGAFAAAAGRGASAFVEAFRSAVGTHRNSYGSGRRRSYG